MTDHVTVKSTCLHSIEPYISCYLQPHQHQFGINHSIHTMSAPAQFLDFIDKNADKFIQRLADAVAIPRSVI